MLEFRVLGPLTLRGADGESLSSVLAQPKRTALLAFLAVDGLNALHSRDRLLGLFWPELDHQHARSALRKALQFLSQHLGEEVVVRSGDEVGIARGALWCDAAAFEQAFEGGELEKAVGLYGGLLLEGFHVRSADEFERWLDGKQRRLAARYTEALESLATRAEEAGRFVRAVGWWQRLTEEDPYNSRVALRLMKALTAAGDPANALKHAEEHERRLRSELDIDLDAEIRVFVDRLRRDAARTQTAVSRHISPIASAEATGAEGAHPAKVRQGETSVIGAVPQSRVRRWFTRPRVFGVAAVGTVALLAAAYGGLRAVGIKPFDRAVGETVPEARDAIVLVDWEDHTGDPTKALMVTELMRVGLSESAVAKVADRTFVRRVLTRMESDPREPLDFDRAREVAVREGLKAVVAGEISRWGSTYVLSARVVAGDTGELLGSFREVAEGPDAIISAVDKLSARLREAIGESLKSIRASPPLKQVRTASLQALRLYTEGVRANIHDGEFRLACDLASRAIEIDSTFVAAYRLRAHCLTNLGIGRAQLIADATRAYELRHRLTLKEQYNSEAVYHQMVTGDMEALIHAWKMVLRIDPEWATAYNQMGGAYTALRDYERAEEMFRRRLELDSLAGTSWSGLVGSQINQGRYAEAEATLRDFESKRPQHPLILLNRAKLASVLGDYRTAETHLRAWKKRHAASDVYRSQASRYLARLAQLQGKLAEAQRQFEEALDLAEECELPVSYLEIAVELAGLRFWLLEDTAGAIRIVASALARYPLNALEPADRPYAELAGFLAFAGESRRAHQLLAEWEAAVPPELRRNQETLRRLAWGSVAVAEGRFADALVTVQFSHQRASCPTCQLPLLGRVFEALGRPDSALAMYDRYLATPYDLRTLGGISPISGHDPFWLPVVYERVATLQLGKGNTVDAASYYSKLVDLWKDADPELQHRVAAARRRMEALTKPVD